MRQIQTSDIDPPSPGLQKIINGFKYWGWSGFWIQVVLGVISMVLLLQLLLVRRAPNPAVGIETNPATLPGLGFAWLGLAVVGLSVLWNFRYTRIARQLRTLDRPSKSQTILQLKIGLGLSLGGMLVTLLATASIVGALTVRVQQGSFGGTGGFNLTVQPIDFQIIQASLNTILAHYAGLVISLGLLNQISNRPE
ncbi:MAG: DUF3611 family protein [Pseudanabaenaceae cyanobacterium bins.68]|nr:DUF3611 family protein [Pseudanabaenaceae cyanobacterium bins.68]